MKGFAGGGDWGQSSRHSAHRRGRLAGAGAGGREERGLPEPGSSRLMRRGLDVGVHVTAVGAQVTPLMSVWLALWSAK